MSQYILRSEGGGGGGNFPMIGNGHVFPVAIYVVGDEIYNVMIVLIT